MQVIAIIAIFISFQLVIEFLIYALNEFFCGS